MTRSILISSLFLTSAVWAQQPTDLASSLKSQYKQNQGYILKSADKWPEDQYGWRPQGLASELRTFGQLLVHIAGENYAQCNRVLGKPVPAAMDDTKASYTKEQATKIVKDSFAFCDPVFESLTVANLNDPITIPGRNNTTSQRARATSLILDLTHSNEQYGMIMVYFALKGMVPVSHEK